MADQLLSEGAEIIVYDPKVSLARMQMDLQILWEYRGEMKTEINEKLAKLYSVNSPAAACTKAQALAVITEWDVFQTQDFETIFNQMKNQPLFLTVEKF